MWLLVYGLALAASPFVIAFALNRFVRPAFDRVIDILFSAWEDGSGRSPGSRSFSFSFGTPPMPREPGRSNAPPLALDLGLAAEYREAWHEVRRRFEEDPADAVRRAHRLLLDVCGATGHTGAFSRTGQFAAAAPSGVGSVLHDAARRLHEARAAQGAIQAALAGTPAKAEDLGRAMEEYERLLDDLLGAASPSNQPL